VAIGGQAIVRIIGDDSHASATLKKFNSDVSAQKRAFDKDFGEIAAIAQRSMLVVGAAVAAAGFAIHEFGESYDAVIAAQRKLEAASKLTGASLTVLEATARQVRSQFALSVPLANDLTAAVTKLAAKSGDASRTAEGIAAFLNLGAGQGLDAVQTLTAVEQAILGIDEGTDKLFQKNPSVLYAEYAAQIGKTAGALSDAEKAQALLNAAIDASTKLGDQYTGFLETAAGKAQQMKTALEDAKAELGELTLPARLAGLETMTRLFEGLAIQARGFADAVSIGVAAFGRGGLTAAAVKAAQIDQRRAQEKQGRDRQALLDHETMTQLAPLQAGQESPQQRAAREKAELDARIKALQGGVGGGGRSGVSVGDPTFRTAQQDADLARKLIDEAFQLSLDALPGVGSAMGDLGRRDRARNQAVVAGAARHTETDERLMQEHAQAVEYATDVIAFNLTDSLMMLATDLGAADEALKHFITSLSREIGGGLMQAGAQQLVGGLGGSLAEKLGSIGGPAAMLGIGFGISALGSLFGSSQDREQEQYRAHLRALKEARKQDTNVTIVMPRGTRSPFDAQWMETIAQTLDAITGAGMGRVNLTYKDA